MSDENAELPFVEDVESDVEVNDTDTGDPIHFWEGKQKELVTSVVDYNLEALTGLVRSKQIDLSPRYQRRHRWDAKRQSLLIESFLMNVPVPPIFLNEDDYGKYSVIDGKQRLTAITEFMLGRLQLRRLEVFSDINGKTFDDLPSELQSVMRVRPTLRAQIILRQSDPDIKFEVFQRLNTGGVKLNAQEIRNSAFPGPLNDLILDLSESSQFHSILGISAPRRSKMHQEMRDAEFVLRYFAFCDDWQTFKGGMKRRMDHFMENNQRASDKALKTLEQRFRKTLDCVQAAFGDRPFRRWLPDQEKWKSQVLASIYDAQMFACQDFDPDQLRPHQAKIAEAFKTLLSDTDFRKTIDAATNTPSFFRDRICRTKQMIDAILAG